MGTIAKCSLCGETLLPRMVEKIVRGGVLAAVVKVKASECPVCHTLKYADGAEALFRRVSEALSNRGREGMAYEDVVHDAVAKLCR